MQADHMEDGLMLATFFRSRNRDITALAKYPPHTADHGAFTNLHPRD